MLSISLALIMGGAIGLRGSALSFLMGGLAIFAVAIAAFALSGAITLVGLLAFAGAVLGYNMGLGAGLVSRMLRPAHLA